MVKCQATIKFLNHQKHREKPRNFSFAVSLCLFWSVYRATTMPQRRECVPFVALWHLAEGSCSTMTDKKGPSDPRVERFHQVFKRLQQDIVWTLLVGIALYSYFYPPSVGGVTVFLLLIGVARGSIPLSQAIALLRSFQFPTKLLPPAKGQEPNTQLGEQATDEQAKPE
jgi:hypothetical protein